MADDWEQFPGVLRTSAPVVLIVEHNALFRNALATMLESDARVEFVTTAVQAREFLKEQDAAVVLFDIEMPGDTGMELLSNIREIRPETMMVVVSSAPKVNRSLEALQRGAFYYIAKPFSLEWVR